MSSATNDPDPSPAESIDDFSDMDVAQTGHARFIVSNRASGTVYEVILADPPRCDCDAFQYDAGDGNACKHIQAAVFAAPGTIDATEYALKQVVQQQSNIRATADRLEQQASSLEAEVAGARSAMTEGVDDELEAGGMTKSDAEYVYEYLEERGVPREKVEVWESDQGSIQIETQEQLDDDEFAVLQDTEEIWYDGEENRNFIKEDNLGELLG